MSGDERQYLPNDCTIQVDFDPNPRVLDKRGEWAASLSQRMTLAKWAIGKDRIDVFDESRRNHCYVAFNRCGLTTLDTRGHECFIEYAGRFLRKVFALDGFGSVTVNRIGLKPRFCTPYQGTFEQLLKRVRERYYDLKPDALRAIGDSVDVTDVGAMLNLRDSFGNFNTHCGAMERSQTKEILTNRRDDDLPEVGLYYEIDYFVNPKEVMDVETVLDRASDFAREAWNRHLRVRKQIVGG